MVAYLGDFLEDATVYIPFNTFSSNDPSASVTITDLADADIMVHKDGGTTQIVTDGATVAIDFDGITGNHLITIDTSAHADYSTGSDYMVRIEGTTVDGGTVNAWIAQFSIQNRLTSNILTDTEAVLVDSEAIITDAEAILADTEAATGVITDTEAILTDTEAAITERSTLLTDTEAILVDTEQVGTAGAGLTDLGGMSTGMKAEVESEANDALVAQKLDHLVAVADADDPVDDSIMAKIVSQTADWSTFDPQIESLEGLEHRIANIASTGAAFHAAAESATVADSGVETGTFANTEHRDGVLHSVAQGSTDVDVYYQFDVGASGLAVEVEWTAYLQGNNDTMVVQVWDWVGTDWETLANLVGTSGTTAETELEALFSKHTGTGGDVGKVRIRFFNQSQSSEIFVDQIFVAYAEALSGDVTDILTDTEAVITDTEAILTDSEAIIADTETGITERATLLTDTEAIVSDTEASQTAETAILADTEAAITERSTLLTDTEAVLVDTEASQVAETAILSDTETGITERATLLTDTEAILVDTEAATGVIADTEAILTDTEAIITDAEAILVDTEAGALADTMEAFFQLTLRSDAAITTDRSVELALINANEGSGAGDFAATSESLEALGDTIITDTESILTDSESILTDTEAATGVITDTEAILSDTEASQTTEAAILVDTEAATGVITDTEAILTDVEASRVDEAAILVDTEAAITERSTLLTDTEAILTDSEAIITDAEAILIDTEAATGVITDTEAILTDSEAIISDTEAVLTDAEAILADTGTDGVKLHATQPTGWAANLVQSAGQIIIGTVDTVTNTHTPTTTEFQADDLLEATADHYNGRVVIFTSGVLAGQATSISDYVAVGGIGQITCVALTEAPSNNDTFIII